MLVPSLRSAIYLKGQLLVEGCGLDKSFRLPTEGHRKTTHLYAHSAFGSTAALPEDVYVVGQKLGIRFRFNPTSRWKLYGDGEGQFWVEAPGHPRIAVTLGMRPDFGEVQVDGHPLTSIVSRLGTDVLGLAPSNACFYFAQKVACRFCEILPNYQHDVAYPKARKPNTVQTEAVRAALAADSHLRHVAVTSGNVVSYDETVKMFCAIGEKAFTDAPHLEQTLATLMPPDDFTLIDKLRDAGFSKVYFPLEVFNEQLFHTICPGKAKYGYARILDALRYAIKVFGEGHVYTNFIYGIQAWAPGEPFNAAQENLGALKATQAMLQLGVIPAFTVYHYSGHNSIGAINLDPAAMSCFFLEWGELVHAAGLVCSQAEAALFGAASLTNTLFNDGFCHARNLAQETQVA